jgi:hypothetical protein
LHDNEKNVRQMDNAAKYFILVGSFYRLNRFSR